MKKTIYSLLIACSSLGFTACEDLLEESPVHLITDDQVIIDAESAEGALLGVYSNLQSGDLYGQLLIGMPGVLSDELVHSGSYPTVRDLDNNEVTSSNVTMSGVWEQAYSGIYQANTVIKSLTENPPAGLSEEEVKAFIGEARFLRALLHLDVVKLYGGAPIAVTTDVTELSTLPRETEAASYAFITSELETAATELAGADVTVHRASEWAALGLAARAHLYAGNTKRAGELADKVIKEGPFEIDPNYNNIFTPGQGSNEVIFRVFSSVNDQIGAAFWFNPNGRFEYAVGPEQLAAYEAGSERAMIVKNGGDPLGRYFVAKYTDVATGTDQPVVLRLAEMYLIRAEANLGTSQAVADVNVLRERAGLDDVSSVTLDRILQERFTELAFEGHRWNDLRRTGKINEVMSAVNPDTWDATDALLPVPQREIDNNPSITQADQNPGY